MCRHAKQSYRQPGWYPLIGKLKVKLDHYLGAALDAADIAHAERDLARKIREVDRLTSENHALTARLRELQNELADVSEDLAAERRAAWRSTVG